MHRLDAHQPLTSSRLALTPGNSISQVFYSHRDSLDTVSICLRNPDRVLLPLTFSLVDSHGTTLRTLPFSSGNIDNQDCTKFQFDPILSSAKASFTATISVAPVDPKAFPIPPNIYAESHEGTLHFKTFYYQSGSDVAKESFNQLFPRFGQDWGFTFIWTICVGYLLYRLWKLARK